MAASTNSVQRFLSSFSTSLNVFHFFVQLGGIKAPAGHEEEEAGDVKDTDRVSESKFVSYLLSFSFFPFAPFSLTARPSPARP